MRRGWSKEARLEHNTTEESTREVPRPLHGGQVGGGDYRAPPHAQRLLTLDHLLHHHKRLHYY